MTIPAFVDDLRRRHGYMTLDEIAALVARGNTVFDPFSTLLSARARIGSGNVFHPCVTLDCGPEGRLEIGDDNLFHAQTSLVAQTGAIFVGDRNTLGDGGFHAAANRPGADIRIGDDGRYLGGVRVFGLTRLGSGSQILGAITVDDCTLAAGGSHRHPVPDERGAVLKGRGSARRLDLAQGRVIVGDGTFRAEDAEPQSNHHPKG